MADQPEEGPENMADDGVVQDFWAWADEHPDEVRKMRQAGFGPPEGETQLTEHGA
jgi:hypothetical protein